MASPPRPVSPSVPPAPVIAKAGNAPSPPALVPTSPSAASPTLDASQALTKEEKQTLAFVAFSSWADQFLAGKASASPGQGQALAYRRREVMAELIETNPKKAIEMSAPYAWRAGLPASVTRFFEQWVDARGSYEAAVATDFDAGTAKVHRSIEVAGKRYQAFVYGWRDRQVSQKSTPLHGIALDRKIALTPDAARILDPAEADALAKARGQTPDPICSVSGKQADSRGGIVPADVGGELQYFCGVDHLKLLNQQAQFAAAGGATAGPGAFSTPANDAWTRGRKTLLYMRMNFPDDLTEPISVAEAADVMNKVNKFYTLGSYDLTAITATITPVVTTLPFPKAYYTTAGPGALQADARAATRQAGYDTADYDWDIVCITKVQGYDWGGLAAVHGKGVWLQSYGVGVTCHELGHNYGLWHANSWNTATNESIIGPGEHIEYGNIYDTMGPAGGWEFNVVHKHTLDWLPDSAVQNVSTSGVYRIYAFETPHRQDGQYYAAHAYKDFQRDYWIEHRESFPSNPWQYNGLMLQWSPWSESSGGPHLLDTTPGTPTASLSREDAALVVGRTFSDTAAGVHITPLQRSGDATNAWFDVQFNLGHFPSNQPPIAALEIDLTNAAPNAVVHFHCTATDPNDDTLSYAWSFDDFTFATNNLPWTFKKWSAAGEHVVRCVVSDMKGGVASVNGVVTVGAPTGFRLAGRVTDTNGVPLQGVRVGNEGTNILSYLGGYSDTEGRYVITGVPANINLNAVLYGYIITSTYGPGSLNVLSNMTDVDFVATPIPTVGLSVTTNVVAENGGGSQTITLTRTGDLSADLPISLNLYGTATLGSDYSLAPTLALGTNTVTIPTGTNSISFTFTPLNDANVEGPETVSITILEDPAYMVVALNEATITILSEDQPSLPAVSITAITATIPESGPDPGLLQFSRNGSTVGDLTVFYTVAGTATPGTDYSSLPGVVVIPSGSSSAIVNVRAFDDKDVELDETVIATISANGAYTIGTSSATVKILDDDLLSVSVAVTDDSASEPSTSGRFTVKRDGDLTESLVVGYTVGGTATPGLDYTALSGSVTIPATATSADIVVNPLSDAIVEGDESVSITLTNNPGYDVTDPGVATLFIHDAQKVSVSVTATDETASEPGSDTGMFRVSRGAVTSGNLTVNLAVSGSAVNGVDYVPIDSTVVIPDGASSVDVEIIPFDDLQIEYDETVLISVLPSTNYNILLPNLATITISDEDSSSIPSVGFCAATSSVFESLSPGVCVGLSVTSHTATVTVDYRVIGGTAPAGDYTLAPGPITFDPGDWAKTIPLTINNNSTLQSNRTIRLVVFNPSNATLDGIKIHTYTIVDDDLTTVTVAATATPATETNSVAGNFRITRTGSTNAAQVVYYQVTGTASAPSDYAPLGTSITIPAGATFVDLPVLPTDDRTVELTQTVVLTLTSTPGGRVVTPKTATVTIGDNDPDTLPVVWITSSNAPFAAKGGANGLFVLSRSTTNGGPLSVYCSIRGSAINGVDYAQLTNVFTIPDGETSLNIQVIAVDDALVEGDETVTLALENRATYRPAYPAEATVTILDDDQSVRLDASDFTAAEPGTDTGEFTFTRFGTTNGALQIFYKISGTASNGLDYAAISNSIVIPAGSLSVKLPIVPLDDTLVEGTETVTLSLLGDPSYVLGAFTNATVTINDDEPMVTIDAPVADVIEGSQTPGVFRITRTGNPDYDITVRVAIGGTATYGVDYLPMLTNVHFACQSMTVDLQVYPTNELVIEPTETVTASLLPDPSYTILSPSNAVVHIIDAGNNLAPIVTITSPAASNIFLLQTNPNIILEAFVVDDGDTNSLTYLWSQVGGSNSLAFGDPTALNTTVSISNSGVYVLQLTADDGVLQGYATVVINVDAAGLLATNILHWNFDDGTGTTALDSSGMGHDGVLAGPPLWVTNGQTGGALSFAGGGQHVRDAAGTNFLDGLGEFTLSLWVRSDSTNLEQGILTADDTGTNHTFAINTRALASCGAATNVTEITIPTTAGVSRFVSRSNLVGHGWQNLVVAWSNGLAPVLFINGRADQPLVQLFPLEGVLTNCPHFIVGKGPAAISNSWNGLIDDVRLFPRMLSPGEIAAIATLPPPNYGPVVDAGSNIVVQLIVPAELDGVATDDGKPVPPGLLVTTWTNISGPVPIILTNANSLTNVIQFTQAGDYVFRLIGDDGQVKVYDETTVTVIEPTRIDVYASDGDAAELGPNPGQFTFNRDDTTADLTVYLAMSGTASNGVDFVSLTNVIFFPAGSNTVVMDVIPYLDDRTEGDETVIFTVITNLSYSIGSGSATVTIHDSPYGVWNIAHFTLEELTDPLLSGEGADYDHDGIVNLAEYAVNRDPKFPETNAPLVTAFELNPQTGKTNLTLTYHRRIEPTDVGYASYVANEISTWYTGTNYIVPISTNDDGNTLTETIKERVVAPWSPKTNQFISVRVWLRVTRP